ncbi:MAG: hypothetical protein FWD99_09455 [Oscillospiraceae bacterium]|nr:hypothetical protein [Oscillospiraceae bacterium]
MKQILFLFLAIVLLVGLAACGNNLDAAIVGSWECLDTSIPHQWMCLLIFDENGRFVDADGDEGSFQTRGDALTLNFDAFRPITVSYSIRGNQLTLTGDGINVVLTRQQVI